MRNSGVVMSSDRTRTLAIFMSMSGLGVRKSGSKGGSRLDHCNQDILSINKPLKINSAIKTVISKVPLHIEAQV